MATKSKIEWTDATLNPTTGCDKISPGCKNCYAERESKHQQTMGVKKYQNCFALTLHPSTLEWPLHLKKPSRIFINSMSDLFHKDVPLEFIQQVFDVMGRSPQHHFQILTKRSERLLELSSQLPWHENVWMGVSIETSEYVSRIEHLRQTAAKKKFLSLEPLLGPLPNLDLRGIDWVIVGGESGPRARPMQADWARDIRDQVKSAGIPFFFKQWGKIANNPDSTDPTIKKRGDKKGAKGGKLLDGREWSELPGYVREGEFMTRSPRKKPYLSMPGITDRAQSGQTEGG